MASNTIVIVGPMAFGKTRYSKAFATHFGCDKIHDDWEQKPKWARKPSAIAAGGLYLAHQVDKARLPDFVTVLTIKDALAKIGVA